MTANVQKARIWSQKRKSLGSGLNFGTLIIKDECRRIM